MSIGEHEWSRVEIKAKLAEAGQIHCEKVPDPDLKSQLAMCTTHNGQLQARIKRKDMAMAEAQMWLSVGATTRAREVLNRAIIDM